MVRREKLNSVYLTTDWTNSLFVEIYNVSTALIRKNENTYNFNFTTQIRTSECSLCIFAFKYFLFSKQNIQVLPFFQYPPLK